MGTAGIIVRGVITLAILGAAVALSIVGDDPTVRTVAWSLASGALMWWAPSPLARRA